MQYIIWFSSKGTDRCNIVSCLAYLSAIWYRARNLNLLAILLLYSPLNIHIHFLICPTGLQINCYWKLSLTWYHHCPLLEAFIHMIPPLSKNQLRYMHNWRLFYKVEVLLDIWNSLVLGFVCWFKVSILWKNNGIIFSA